MIKVLESRMRRISIENPRNPDKSGQGIGSLLPFSNQLVIHRIPEERCPK